MTEFRPFCPDKFCKQNWQYFQVEVSQPGDKCFILALISYPIYQDIDYDEYPFYLENDVPPLIVLLESDQEKSKPSHFYLKSVDGETTITEDDQELEFPVRVKIVTKKLTKKYLVIY